MPSFKLSVDDENVPWLNLTKKLPKTETVAVRSCRSQSHNHSYVRANRHTQTHTLLGDTCLLMSSPLLWGQPGVSPLNSELHDLTSAYRLCPINTHFDISVIEIYRTVIFS